MVAMAVQLRDRGVFVIPSELRRELGLEEGALLLVERREGGLFVRPAVAVPVERYTPARKAQFLLNDAFDAKSYARARKLVEGMGLDPESIPHERPHASAHPRVPRRQRSSRRRSQS